MTTGKLHAQEKYEDRMKRLGHIRVGAWIPKKDRDELLDFAFDLRVKHEETFTPPRPNALLP
jgi:hypothetical protein